MYVEYSNNREEIVSKSNKSIQSKWFFQDRAKFDPILAIFKQNETVQSEKKCSAINIFIRTRWPTVDCVCSLDSQEDFEGQDTIIFMVRSRTDITLQYM